MTACTNHGGKARRVVTAALVGVLSVGTVPMVALAEGVSDAVSPMFAEGGIDGTEFAKGSVAIALTPAPGSTATVITPELDVDGNVTVTADQLPFTVTATSVTPAGASNLDTIDVTPGSDFKVALYKADENGEPTGTALSGSRILSAGDYVITVTPLTGSDYVGQTFKQTFKVVPVQIKADNVFENNNPSDKHFVFSGSALDLQFAMGGKTLVEGKDYTVKYTGDDGKTYDEVVNSGRYTAKLTGLGMYAGTSTTTAPFEVYGYTLNSDSEIVIAPYKDEMPDHPESIHYPLGGPTIVSDLDPSLVTFFNTGEASEVGPHQVELKVNQDAVAAGNVIYDNDSPLTATVVKVDAFSNFFYNGQELQDSYDIFPGQAFNLAGITASYNGIQLGVCGDAYVTASGDTNFSTVGEHTFTVSYNVNGDAIVGTDLNGKVIAGSKTVTVRVWAGAINADESLWVYGPDSDTVAINSYSKAYDGQPLTASDFLVTNKDQTVTSRNYLDAKLYDAEGNEVAQAVNAGTYTLKITSDDYKLSGTTEMTITIGKVDLASTEVGELELWNDVAGEEYLPLVDVFVDADGDGKADKVVVDAYVCGTNGLAISELGLVYNTGNEGAGYDEDGYVYNDFKGQDLLPDNVDVVVEYNDGGTWKPVANIDKPGQFRVSLTVGEDVAANYTATSKTLEFTVAYKTRFSDVQPSDWYYEAVNKAYTNSYMNGYGGTTTFGPEDKLTRAQAVIVLFNMSGAYFNETNSNYNETSGWLTGFDDVDGNMYYAQAIAWAKTNGVVNGYDEDTFGPEDEITREQFAAMLANYAKVVNRDETVDDVDGSALAELPDANTVSDWATSAVAWAVENGVMGNNGSVMAQNTITRGEVAAMAVNYQPNAK